MTTMNDRAIRAIMIFLSVILVAGIFISTFVD